MAFIGLLTGGLLGALPAVAQTTQTAGPHIAVSPTAGPPGTSVTVTGSGFCASGCSAVTIEFNGVPAQSNVAVSASGSFAVSITVTSGAGTVDVLAFQTKASETIQALAYFQNTPSTPVTPHPVSHPVTAAPSHPTKRGAPASPTTTTPPSTGNGSAQSPATAVASASHSDGGPSALVLALASLGGALVLGAGGFAARQYTRRRTSG